MTTYLDESRPLPYCPGCGHPHVLKSLDAALEASGLPRERIVLVTDIGCVGLADAHFPTLHTVHALHGRAAAIASGLRMAKEGHDLKPVVLVGDGGASIGLLHLVHAAQLNVDVTILVHNNLIYGMTGGQHSTLTPDGLRTTTTPEGCPVPPLDLEAVLRGAGATFFARARAPGADLEAHLAEALAHPGFAVVEALELCPTFASRVGGVTGKDLNAMADGRTGVLHHDTTRAAFEPCGERQAFDPRAGGVAPEAAWARLDGKKGIVLAGKAGERVQSAAKTAARAALAAGLHASVRTDNPVTQGRGFSLAELSLSPDPIHYTGMERPDLVVVVAEEGRQILQTRRMLEFAAEVPFVVEETITPIEGAAVDARPLRKTYGAKGAALGGLLEELIRAGWWTSDAWERALASLPAPIEAETRKLLDRAAATTAS